MSNTGQEVQGAPSSLLTEAPNAEGRSRKFRRPRRLNKETLPKACFVVPMIHEQKETLTDTMGATHSISRMKNSCNRVTYTMKTTVFGDEDKIVTKEKTYWQELPFRTDNPEDSEGMQGCKALRDGHDSQDVVMALASNGAMNRMYTMIAIPDEDVIEPEDVALFQFSTADGIKQVQPEVTQAREDSAEMKVIKKKLSQPVFKRRNPLNVGTTKVSSHTAPSQVGTN